ncbi:MAG: site-specific DNA-methyltransferase, partial [Acidimicrobiia bacterium]|nr:site-specific DNA-methyltransferase [Acidimicrobiia bacterium]
AGSGTSGAVASKLGRRFIMVDNNPEALAVMRRRLNAGTAPISFVTTAGETSEALGA